MKLSQAINIRLSEQSMYIYQAEAKAKDLPLTTYIRNVLDERLEGNNAAEEIRNLRRTLEYLLPDFDLFNSGKNIENDKENDDDKRDVYISNSSSSQNLISPLLELLFIMRRSTEIPIQNIVRKELERLGYKVWNAEDREKELAELTALGGRRDSRR